MLNLNDFIKKYKKILLVLFIVIILFIILLLIYKYNEKLKLEEQKLLNDIKSHYNIYVKTNKNTDLYILKDGEYIKNSKVDANFDFELDNINIDDTKQQYFKIKDTKYYIYYKDINKGEKKDYVIPDNYLVFNQNIQTKNKTIFYQIGGESLTLNDIFSLPIRYSDDEYYYVIYLDKLLKVKKDEVEVIDSINTDSTKQEYISILYYKCIGNKSECVTTDKLKEQLAYLKDNGYYTITLDDYKKWLNKNINLKEKAILLTTESNEFDSIVKEYNFNINLLDSSLKFNNTNKKTTLESNQESLDRYIIKRNTTIEDYKKMVLGEEVKEIIIPSTNDSSQKIAVLNYHFFYDSSLGESCNESICLDTKDFEEQLAYLKNNNYKTLTMEEFRAWMYGEIELPEKSILLTIDDGAMGTGSHNGNKLIPLLEKYDAHATLFLITGWWDINNYKSDHLDIESHTNDMHTGGLCNATRGAKILCSSKEEVLADLKKSIEITKSTTAFCFPFYAYNNQAIANVKEAGFKLAFVGGNYKASRNSNKYMIPRYPIYKTTTLSQFINMIS